MFQYFHCTILIYHDSQLYNCPSTREASKYACYKNENTYTTKLYRENVILKLTYWRYVTHSSNL